VNHAYVMLNMFDDEENQYMLLRNPWGTNTSIYC